MGVGGDKILRLDMGGFLLPVSEPSRPGLGR